MAQPRTYDYRCIRLLGFEHYHSVDDQAQSYAQVDAMQHLIRLDWLASLNYRTSEFYIEEALQSSPANSYYNYPYSAFYYRDVDITTDTIPAGCCPTTVRWLSSVT